MTTKPSEILLAAAESYEAQGKVCRFTTGTNHGPSCAIGHIAKAAGLDVQKAYVYVDSDAVGRTVGDALAKVISEEEGRCQPYHTPSSIITRFNDEGRRSGRRVSMRQVVTRFRKAARRLQKAGL